VAVPSSKHWHVESQSTLKVKISRGSVMSAGAVLAEVINPKVLLDGVLARMICEEG
jgi:hypothetical protein